MTRLSHSRAVEEVGYDATTGTLRVRFRDGGGLYDYLNVPEHVFEGLLASAHPWTEWGQHIKATYRVHRVE